MIRTNNKSGGSLRCGSKLVAPLLAFLLALSCLGLLLNHLNERHHQSLYDHFLTETQYSTTTIDWYLGAYAQILHGAAGLFSASGQVSRDSWHSYVEHLELDEVYGGIQGVGFTQFIPAEKLVSHEQAMRAQGFKEYRVSPQGARDAYSSIIYLEPFDERNRRAFGYDMFSDPVRRAAMEQARDSGNVAFSGKVTLVQETDQDVQAGILAYHPVYREGAFPRTLEQRRAALLGWAYSPYRMSDLISAILKGRPANIRLEIYDGADPLDATTLLYDSAPTGERPDDSQFFLQETALKLAGGRTWTLRYSSLPSFASSYQLTAPWVEYTAIGLIGFLLCALSWSLYSTKRRADRIAGQMTVSLSESQREFRLLSERLAEVIWATNVGTWEWNLITGDAIFNERWAEMLGYRLDELEPNGIEAWQRLTHPDDFKCSQVKLDRCFNRESKLYECEVRMRHKDGRWIWIMDRGQVVEWTEDYRPLRMSGTHQDITAWKEAEQNLRLASCVLDNARECIVITDSNGLVLKSNQPFTDFTSYTHEEILGKPVWFIFAGRHSEKFFEKIRQSCAETDHWSGEVWSRRKNGELRISMLTLSAIRTSGGEISNWLVLFSDITSRKEQQVQLEHIAHHDALTGLPNRVLLSDRLQQAMAQAERDHRHIALIYLDLDGFKAVNDLHGHDAGDELLVILAKRMKVILRETDTLARIGGDEFVAVLTGLEKSRDCERVLARFLSAIAEPVVLRSATVQVTASIGVTFYPQPRISAELLQKQADQAMYQAKNLGRNRYQIFEHQPQSAQDMHAC